MFFSFLCNGICIGSYFAVPAKCPKYLVYITLKQGVSKNIYLLVHDCFKLERGAGDVRDRRMR